MKKNQMQNVIKNHHDDDDPPLALNNLDEDTDDNQDLLGSFHGVPDVDDQRDGR